MVPTNLSAESQVLGWFSSKPVKVSPHPPTQGATICGFPTVHGTRWPSLLIEKTLKLPEVQDQF